MLSSSGAGNWEESGSPPSSSSSSSKSSRHHLHEHMTAGDEENDQFIVRMEGENEYNSSPTRKKEGKRNMFFSVAILGSSLLFCALLAMTYLSRTVQEADRSTKTGVFEVVNEQTDQALADYKAAILASVFQGSTKVTAPTTPIVTTTTTTTTSTESVPPIVPEATPTETDPVMTATNPEAPIMTMNPEAPVMTMNGDDGTGTYDASTYASTTSSTNSNTETNIAGLDPLMMNSGTTVMEASPINTEIASTVVTPIITKEVETPVTEETVAPVEESTVIVTPKIEEETKTETVVPETTEPVVADEKVTTEVTTVEKDETTPTTVVEKEEVMTATDEVEAAKTSESVSDVTVASSASTTTSSTEDETATVVETVKDTTTVTETEATTTESTTEQPQTTSSVETSSSSSSSSSTPEENSVVSTVDQTITTETTKAEEVEETTVTSSETTETIDKTESAEVIESDKTEETNTNDVSTSEVTSEGTEETSSTMTSSGEAGEEMVEETVVMEDEPTEEPTETPTETPSEQPTEQPTLAPVVLPNIVFLLADDLGFSSIGYKETMRGYKEWDHSFATPVLTGMAQEGLIMTNYYAQEVCTPSRAALLTGRYPLSSGMQYGVIDTRVPWGLDLSEQTLAEVLRDAGYKTHALGKWHLGHHTPKYLPTARGFESFVGFLNGDSYYYSKINPLEHTYVDLLRSDTKCYYPYTDADLFDYSTTLYQNKAVDIILNHEQSSPLFLYMPFQAVHDPFDDVASFYDVKEQVPTAIKDMIKTYVKGTKRTEYVYALYIMDQAIGAIKLALESSGMMDNTYIIFASDNGGCNGAGGKMAPYRGTKGSLFEGGTKVDSFVYSPLLSSNLKGTSFDKLFHVTDWFPTILDMAGIEFEPRFGFDLDGVSQYKSWSTGVAARTVMLYNSAYNVKERDFQYSINSAFAIRNERFKLMHYFNSSYYADWYDPTVISEDDDESNESECSATSSYSFLGEYNKALFDLVNDPYEQVNLYDSAKGGISVVKSQLYSLIDYYNMRSRQDLVKSVKALDTATSAWDGANGYIVPFEQDEGDNEKEPYSGSYPQYCEPKLGGKTIPGGVTLGRRQR